MKKITTEWRAVLAISALTAAGVGAAQAQNISAERLYNLSLAATCANCHGTNGVSVAGDLMHPINNYTANEIETRLKEYKAGTRSGTIMPQLAKGYTEEQLKIIAEVLGKKN
jgi:cytochrome subunit of sulfide dehydrogenase